MVDPIMSQANGETTFTAGRNKFLNAVVWRINFNSSLQEETQGFDAQFVCKNAVFVHFVYIILKICLVIEAAI